jgi:hypothetical protein
MTTTDVVPVSQAIEPPVVDDVGARLEAKVFTCLRESDLLGAMQALIALTDARMGEFAGDIDALGHGIRNLTQLTAALRTLTDEVKKLARAWLDESDQYKVAVEGVGVIKKDSGLTRTEWRHADLLAEVIKRGFASGRIAYPNELPKFLLEVFGSPSWKVGQEDKATGEWSGLRGLGLDPADWCVEGRNHTVTIEGAPK